MAGAPVPYSCGASCVSEHVYRASASSAILVVAGRPPAVSIASAVRGKCDPGLRLALLGSAAPADARAAAGGLNFTWRVARRGDDGGFGAVALLTLTGLHALNLVVAAGQLAPGATYRFTLEARTGAGADGSVGSSSLLLSANVPPAFGRVAVRPASGMAVRDTFTLVRPQPVLAPRAAAAHTPCVCC